MLCYLFSFIYYILLILILCDLVLVFVVLFYNYTIADTTRRFPQKRDIEGISPRLVPSSERKHRPH